MQKGILSLMQMAKTSAASSGSGPRPAVHLDPHGSHDRRRHGELRDARRRHPGRAARADRIRRTRVIAETIRQPLPEGFQRSEFLLAHGQLDMIVERRDLKETLRRVLAFFAAEPPRSG
jgi:acetyl-CoA carboxylase carboxyl transferase subunit beta